MTLVHLSPTPPSPTRWEAARAGVKPQLTFTAIELWSPRGIATPSAHKGRDAQWTGATVRRKPSLRRNQSASGQRTQSKALEFDQAVGLIKLIGTSAAQLSDSPLLRLGIPVASGLVGRGVRWWLHRRSR